MKSEQTLNQWASLSIKQRAKMFHRRFGEIKVSPTTIWRAFKKEDIKFKFIAKIKKEVDFRTPHYRDLFAQMFKLLTQCKQQGLKIVYVDEFIFSFNTFRKKAWSQAY